MHPQKPVQIDHILRERRPARNHPAPEHAPRIIIGLVGVGTIGVEVIDLFKIGPVNRHLNGHHAIGQAAKSGWIHRAADYLCKNREAFLNFCRAGMGAAQYFEMLLRITV